METKRWYQSKTVLCAIGIAIVGAIEGISQAMGKPINLSWIYPLLGGGGLYGLRTGTKTIQ